MTKRAPRSSAAAVPGALASLLLEEAAHASGTEPSTLLAQAGIPYSFEDLTSGRANRIPKAYFAALVSQCIATFEQQAARHGDYPPMTNNEYKMLCYCLINCPTLSEAIERAASFCSMLGGRAGRLGLTVTGDQALFTMTTFRAKPSVSAMFADMVGLTGYLRLFSWLCGEYIECGEMGIVYEPFVSSEDIAELFNHPVQFNQKDNYFQFPAKYLSRSNVRSYPELEKLLQFFPFDLLSGDWQSMSLSKAIENIIRRSLLRQQGLPTVEDLAVQFTMSSATLRRRLAEEMTSITLIKEHCRSELAIELIRHSQLSIEEISDNLGFSDTRIFRRAFKQWTQLSPSQYRQSVQKML